MRIVVAVVFMLAGIAQARPEGWHGSMEDGLKAAKKSGKPLLVVTVWKEKL